MPITLAPPAAPVVGRLPHPDPPASSNAPEVAPPPITPEELLLRPDEDRYELVNGRLVEKPMGAYSDNVSMCIVGHLFPHCHARKLGAIQGPDTGYRCFPDDPNKVRKPDVSFIAAARLNRALLPQGYLELAPDLAVESISPHESYYEVMRKVAEYLGAGVRLVWVANPHARTVTIHRANGTVTVLRDQDEITGEDVIPDFVCSIAEFFPPPPDSPPPAEPPAP